MIEIRRMERERRISANDATSVGRSLACRESIVCRSLECHRRTRQPGKGGTMRRITHWHRALTVLAIGLLALAAPLVAYADGSPVGH